MEELQKNFFDLTILLKTVITKRQKRLFSEI